MATSLAAMTASPGSGVPIAVAHVLHRRSVHDFVMLRRRGSVRQLSNRRHHLCCHVKHIGLLELTEQWAHDRFEMLRRLPEVVLVMPEATGERVEDHFQQLAVFRLLAADFLKPMGCIRVGKAVKAYSSVDSARIVALWQTRRRPFNKPDEEWSEGGVEDFVAVFFIRMGPTEVKGLQQDTEERLRVPDDNRFLVMLYCSFEHLQMLHSCDRSVGSDSIPCLINCCEQFLGTDLLSCKRAEMIRHLDVDIILVHPGNSFTNGQECMLKILSREHPGQMIQDADSEAEDRI
ncbi:hypothetical protein KC328_g19 [Hortaea werneckii]|nr:hypothetical protein KC328_g19 [Hortaea werneckii]